MALPLKGCVAEAHDLLVELMARLHAEQASQGVEGHPADLLAWHHPPLREYALLAYRLAEEIARRTLRRKIVFPDRRLRELIHRARAAYERLPPVSESTRGEDHPGSASLIHDDTLALYKAAGFSSLGAMIRPDRASDDGPLVLGAARLRPQTAYVWLQERLLARLEAMTARDPLLRMERRASSWWFANWSRSRKSTQEQEFTRWVREAEWSLIERSTLRFGRPLIYELCDREAFASLPLLEQVLAQGLKLSFSGVFDVVEKEGDAAVFQRPGSADSWTVMEHNPDTEYGPGFIGLGRLIPWRDDCWVRSPGMVFMHHDDPTIGRDMAEGLEESSPGFPEALVIEGILSALLGRVKVPVDLLPDESVAAAGNTLNELVRLLEEAGLAQTTGESEVPAEHLARYRSDGIDRVESVKFDVDECVAEWMKALFRQGNRTGRSGARSSRKRKKGKKRH